jgi:tRNA-2-methylthio-N6-dimethylallyladenosine synthase
MRYFIVTFGCAANEADSERLAAFYAARGYTAAKKIQDANVVIINTCMIREKAAHRVYGLIHNLDKLKIKNEKLKIILTGCMVGMAVRDSSGKMLAQLKKKLPTVDEFLPIEEIGFDQIPVRSDPRHALVPITNGCNNFCTYCVVPFTRGREISRPFDDILRECKGSAHVTLIGQNVNSYGSDLKNNKIKPVYVKHLGRLRIPTLFPALLEAVSRIKGVKIVDFISSNPWDFSDELIDVIARNKNISRHIHLPLQSGDNAVLKRMNRWYTREEYLSLTNKLRKHIRGVTISTDIIVGFCGETRVQFNNTVNLAKKVGFSKAYVAMYSDRPMTAAHKTFTDDVPHAEKKRRWAILEGLINKTNLKNGTYI